MTFGEGPLLRKNIKFFQNVEKKPKHSDFESTW